MISTSLKLAFIHVNKTGGSSISTALRPWEHLPVLAGDHDNAKTVARLLTHAGYNYDHFWSFAFVRNPWDRMVSSFNYRQQKLDKENSQSVPEGIEFGDWMRKTVAPNIGNMEWRDQSLMLEDDDRNIIVDAVYRFEDLTEAWGNICSRLGLSLYLPHTNKTNHKDFRDYYDDETAAIVAKRFSRDIEMFGYSLENT